MKKVVLIAIIFPGLLTAQIKKATKPVSKTLVTKSAIKPADGFEIDGEVSGAADGAKIALLNGLSGAPEMQGTIEKNKFSFKGKLERPGIKILIIDNKPPYLTLFLDNSTVKISAVKESFDRASVTGSPVHSEFEKLNASLIPYQQLFVQNAVPDAALAASAREVIQNFVQKNPASYITPFAIIRYSQVSPDISKTEALFNSLKEPARSSDMSTYIERQIADTKANAAKQMEEEKMNPVGAVLDNFTQADTAGKPLALTSLRGKYVLIDFWASWCRPCRQENPNVVANYNKFKDKNFTVLGVSLDKSKPAWLEAIAMDGLTWPHVSDLQGWSNAVAQQFKIQSIPQNFLIGPDGKLIAKNLRGAALEMKLAELLK